MADKIMLADTSVLIDYFRKTDKTNSALVTLFDQGYDFYISIITHYEIYSGATSNQLLFWKNILRRAMVLPFNEAISETAIDINNELKRKRKQIQMADLFIAATAFYNNLPLATLNNKHFERIDNLMIIK